MEQKMLHSIELMEIIGKACLFEWNHLLKKPSNNGSRAFIFCKQFFLSLGFSIRFGCCFVTRNALGMEVWWICKCTCHHHSDDANAYTRCRSAAICFWLHLKSPSYDASFKWALCFCNSRHSLSKIDWFCFHCSTFNGISQSHGCSEEKRKSRLILCIWNFSLSSFVFCDFCKVHMSYL